MRRVSIVAKLDDYVVEVSTSFENFRNVVVRLMDGFRDIEVTDEETGVLLYQIYWDSEIFVPVEKPQLIVASLVWD